MNQKTVKKINVAYLLCYIFAPLAVAALRDRKSVV